MLKHVFKRPLFHNFPRPHHRHPIGDVFDHAEVMRDEEIRDSGFPLDAAEEIQNLCLNRDIQR